MAGRPKGSKNKPKTDETPGPGHNGPVPLTEEQRQALALQWKGQYEATLAAKNTASSAHSNLCKRLKTELGSDGVDLIKDMIAAETPEGEAALRARVERQLRAAKYMAAPMGQQFTLDMDRTPSVDQAYAEGERDGAAGKTLKPPYDPSVPQHDRWIQGWHAGQRAIFDIQKTRDASAFDGPAENQEEAATA